MHWNLQLGHLNRIGVGVKEEVKFIGWPFCWILMWNDGFYWDKWHKCPSFCFTETIQAMLSLQGMADERLVLNEYLYCFFFQILHDYPLFVYIFTAIFNLNDVKLIVEYVFVIWMIQNKCMFSMCAEKSLWLYLNLSLFKLDHQKSLTFRTDTSLSSWRSEGPHRVMAWLPFQKGVERD